MSTSAFSGEMATISAVKMASAWKRLAEAGIGASLGGGVGYLATGKGDGALVGGGVGAAGGMLAGRVGVHRQAAKKLKELADSTEVRNLQEALERKTKRQDIFEASLAKFDSQDTHPLYFSEAAKRLKVQKGVFDGFENLRKAEKSIIDEIDQARKKRMHFERLAKHQLARHRPIPDKVRAPIANLMDHEKTLRNRLQGIRSVINGRKDLLRKVDIKARDLQRADRNKILSSLKEAQKELQRQAEENKSRLQSLREATRQSVESKLYGVF